MKSLSLDKPLIVMMVGIPGSGKSFFARQFSSAFGAPVVSYDALRSVLFPETAKYSTDEQLLIDRIAKQQVAELIKTKKTFVIDGGCNVRIARQAYAQMARSADYGTLVVWVQTDETTCRNRSIKVGKAEQPLRRALTVAQYESLAKRITQPINETGVVVSGKHTFPAQLRSVLKKLVEPRQAAAQSIKVIAQDAPRSMAARPSRNIIIR